MQKKDCRLCKSENLVMFLNLGHHPHSDNFRKDPNLPETNYPLRLVQCQNCEFVQLDYTVSPDVLYDSDYLYESSITKTANEHWIEFVKTVTNKLKKTGRVLDIGSNDGTLLSKFKELGYTVKGIDPCKDITDIAKSKGIPTVTALFSKEALDGEKFDLITGSNVFAHIDDLDKVMQDVKELLDTNGVFIFESPYLGRFIEDLQYDTVYHQHLSYLAIKPLRKFFKKFGLEVFDIDFTPIHGGCFRCYIAPIGEREVKPIVSESEVKEKFSLHELGIFSAKVEGNRIALNEIVLDMKKQGKKIVGISSPAKGMTLLNYTGVGKYLEFVTDVSKLKQGRYTPGTHLEIKSDKDIEDGMVGLLLAWNFAEEIMRNVPQIKTWIIPNPKPHVIEK